MAADPRRNLFSVKTCPKEARATGQARKKSFLDNITTIGDLEILNNGSINGGDVGKGLRALAAVSDSIRVGKSAVPGREGTDTYNTLLGNVSNTALTAVNEGASVVMDSMGLGGAVEAVGGINTGAANRAWEQGQDLWDRVKRGRFALEDIPEVFADFQNLEILARGIFPGIGGSEKIETRELCGATPYAMDLIAFAPKFQFMFIIEITYATPYNSAWWDNASQVAFVVKTSTRPRFSPEYEEINMYGFRTRVMRRIEYQPMDMAFYDDNKNAAHKFYVSYMRAHSPIANWKNDQGQEILYEESGMAFDRSPSSATFTKTAPKTSGHSASSGPLVGDTTSLLKEIKLHHVYDYGNKMNTYHFYNPRITSFTPSDLTMADSGEGCDYSFEFMYDGLYIDHMIDLSKKTAELHTLTSLWGQRPIDPVYATDSSGLGDGPGEGEPDADQAEADAPTSGFLGGFAEGLQSAADGVTDTFGNVIGGVSNIAGGLTNSLNQTFAQASDQAANLSSGITGAINQGLGAAQRAIGGLGTTISNAFKSDATLASEAKAINDTYNEENLLS